MGSKKFLIALVIFVTQSALASNNDDAAIDAVLPADNAIEINTQDVLQTQEVNEVLRDVRFELSEQRLQKASEKSL